MTATDNKAAIERHFMLAIASLIDTATELGRLTPSDAKGGVADEISALRARLGEERDRVEDLAQARALLAVRAFAEQTADGLQARARAEEASVTFLLSCMQREAHARTTSRRP